MDSDFSTLLMWLLRLSNGVQHPFHFTPKFLIAHSQRKADFNPKNLHNRDQPGACHECQIPVHYINQSFTSLTTELHFTSRCNYNEYCCGDDICCDYLTGYWYLWWVNYDKRLITPFSLLQLFLLFVTYLVNSINQLKVNCSICTCPAIMTSRQVVFLFTSLTIALKTANTS